MNNEVLNRYTDRYWGKLQSEVHDIREQYRRCTLSEAEKHSSADRLHQLCGSLRTAEMLVPLMQAAHKNSVQWALERVLSATVTLGGMAGVDQQKREAMQGRIDGVLRKLDAGEIDAAEQEVRALDVDLTAARMEALDRRVENLLAGIGVAYELNT
jgi:hypothetical protein